MFGMCIVVYKSPGANDKNKLQVKRFRPVQHIVRGLLADRGVWRLVAQSIVGSLLLASLLLASLPLTIAARVLPARSNMPACRGVMVLVCSSGTSV